MKVLVFLYLPFRIGSVLSLLFLAACSNSSVQNNTDSGNELKYIRADVKLILDEEGRVVNQTMRIEDPKEIERLISFFPNLGKGKHSQKAAGWITLVDINLYKDDETVVNVKSNYKYWTEGSGDWAVKGDFEKYIQNIFESSNK